MDSHDQPFICSTDVIGCINFAKDFVVSGTASPNLYGICESFYEESMDQDTIFEAISQSILNAADRDAYTGWGAVVKVITPQEIVTKHLKGRQD